MAKDLESIIKYVKGEVKGVDISVGSNPQYRVKRLPFKIDPLDHILGGGLPYGRTILFKGDFSSGKTFLTQKAIVAAQAAGLTCAYIDVEKGLDPDWFTLTGVDLSNVIVTQPSSGEEALDTAVALVKAETDLVILDSIAALIPTAEVEQGMEQQYVGALARLLNKGLRKITRENKNNSIFIMLNQVRSGIGPAPFPTEALPGGKGQWFFSSIVLDVKRGAWMKEGTGPSAKRIGFTMNLRTEKNKVAPPQQVCQLPFIFEGGVIDVIQGLFTMALDTGIIKQSGAQYLCSVFPDGRVRGKLNVLALMKEHPEIVTYLQEHLHGVDGDEEAVGSRTAPE